MADFWSPWDASGKYRVRIRVWEEGSGGGQAKGRWDIALFGANAANNFYGWNTSGEVNIDGTRHYTWNGVWPTTGWNGTAGIMMNSGTWGPTRGNRTITVTGGLNATSVPAAYGPTSVMWVSASLAVGGGSAATVPAAPVTSITNITARTARVTWNAPSNGGSAITAYGARISTMNSTSPDGAEHTPFWDYAPMSREINASGLLRNKTYYVYVRAANAVGWGPFSPVNSFTTAAYEPPSAPSNYGLADITSETAYTTMPSVADTGGMALSDLQIQHNLTAAEAGATTVTAGAYRSVMMAGLPADTRIYYRMRVFNAAPGGGWGPWGSWVYFHTAANTPSAPRNLQLTPVGDDAILTWEPPAELRGATLQGYTLRYARNESFSSDLRTRQIPAGVGNSAFLELGEGTWWVQMWANTGSGAGAYTVPLKYVVGDETAGTVSINVGGEIKTGTLWINDNGIWKPGSLWVNDNGTWRS